MGHKRRGTNRFLQGDLHKVTAASFNWNKQLYRSRYTRLYFFSHFNVVFYSSMPHQWCETLITTNSHVVTGLGIGQLCSHSYIHRTASEDSTRWWTWWLIIKLNDLTWPCKVITEHLWEKYYKNGNFLWSIKGSLYGGIRLKHYLR